LIYSIDPSVEALEGARLMFRDSDLRLIRAAAEEIPFDDDYFDLVVSLFTTHHLGDLARGFREMLRVTRGRLVIIEWSPASARVHNPHSPEELARTREELLSVIRAVPHRIVNRGLWYGITVDKGSLS
jgi:ubiquinone/menaquinone biosynthesis C-methylase UbiE